MRTAELILPPTDQPEERSPADSRLSTDLLPPGTKVDVRNRLDGLWTKGFEIVTTSESGYQLRRASDDVLLPTTFKLADVRRERRKSNNWWY